VNFPPPPPPRACSFEEKMLKEKDLLCLKFLQSRKFNKKTLKNLLDDNTVRAISECALNLLRGKLKVDQKQKKKLSKYKKELRYLVVGKSKGLKKKIIVQSGGGFLSVLIPAAITLISTLLGK